MPFAEIDGERLYYVDEGGDGLPVLFSHGFLMDHSMFDPQVEALRSAVRCVRWDERGFGLSTCRGAFTYWDSASDAVALLDLLGIEKAVFAGMSQGGFLSLRAALAAPDRVAGLVLIDTCADVDPDEVIAGYQGMHDAWLEHGPVDAVARPVADLILGADFPDTERWLGKWRFRPAEDLTHPFNALVGREDVSDRVGSISCPTLVVHGTDDVSITMDRAEATAAALQDVRGFVRVDGAAHAANLSHPDQVNPPLRDFLDDLQKENV